VGTFTWPKPGTANWPLTPTPAHGEIPSLRWPLSRPGDFAAYVPAAVINPFNLIVGLHYEPQYRNPVPVGALGKTDASERWWEFSAGSAPTAPRVVCGDCWWCRKSNFSRLRAPSSRTAPTAVVTDQRLVGGMEGDDRLFLSPSRPAEPVLPLRRCPWNARTRTSPELFRPGQVHAVDGSGSEIPHAGST